MKKNKGITLIALVITIIVLLILSSISINLVFGDNGIILRAKQAAVESEKADIYDKAIEIIATEVIDKNGVFDQDTAIKAINNGFKNSWINGYDRVVVNDDRFEVVILENGVIEVFEYMGPELGKVKLYVYSKYPTTGKSDVVKVTVAAQIGGIPVFQEYNEYAKRFLNDKTEEEKDKILIDGLNELYGDVLFRTMQDIYSYYEVEDKEGLIDYFNQKTYDEFLIYAKVAGKNEYQEFVENYLNDYGDKIVSVIKPDGKIENITLNKKISFYTSKNGILRFIGEYNNKQMNLDINIDCIGYDTDKQLEKDVQGNYMVASIEDLVVLSQNVSQGYDYEGETIKLTKDLDFNDNSSYKNISDTSFGDINEDGKVEGIKQEVTTGKGFKPIGMIKLFKEINDIYIQPFKGTFDGNSFTIANLYENNDKGEACGLFGFVTSGKISNLNVTGNITGYYYVGGVIGVNESTQAMENLKFTGEVQGHAYIAGIVGYTYSETNDTREIRNCINEGTVTGNVAIAGIVGKGGTITTIESCVNKGNITGSSYTGGIMGDAYKAATIKNCHNEGRIHGSFLCGGIVAYAEQKPTLIKNCYNVGEINADGDGGPWAYTGGIIAKTVDGVIVQDCYNTASVTSSATAPYYSYTAGVCAQVKSGAIVERCYNTGTITRLEPINTGTHTGGVAAVISEENSIVRDCFNTGTIRGVGTSIGGVTSVNYLGKLYNSYNIGKIEPNGQNLKAEIAASCSGDYVVKNSYYLNTTELKGLTGSDSNGENFTAPVSLEYMKTQAFLDDLNRDSVNKWVFKEGVNNGLPVPVEKN